jgi:hypothetical protein
MSQNENPILYVEELQRFPLRRRREPVPGSVMVYRSRNGVLSAPKGGFTAAELLWYSPQVAYEIDVSRHAVTVAGELGDEYADISVSWVVFDPVAVVRARLTDPDDLIREAVQSRLQSAPGTPRDLPLRFTVPEGIQITIHYVYRLSGDDR